MRNLKSIVRSALGLMSTTLILCYGVSQAQIADVSVERLQQAGERLVPYCGKLTAPIMPSKARFISDEEIKQAKSNRDSFYNVVQKYTHCLDRIIETSDPNKPIVAEAALAHDYANIKYGDVSENYILAEIAWQDQGQN